ncbi:hypothetical protein Belba_3676 [Belliella baltica DSM 15883]|uniref:Uncharacterized protein n=1 Tax=Belliella baltica (strain DSM 15883 / CIP 108006 / LMG 21964 / BA134) TaxID=866536 RepID=I3ZA98_BELBD|nr:hypothetical protein [Belliella baltica]AFL86166.1 hypothetical protein Belba_3676 [Belliella baltica DSM 15883]
MEKDPIRITYEKLERNTLILIACSIPFFAVVYLYSQSESITRTSYNLPEIADFILLGLIYVLLAFHYWNFHNAIKSILVLNPDLETKITLYEQATIRRFWILLLSSILCPLGLLLFENNGYIIAYALTLVFLSLGKPTPDRIVRLLRLKGEEKERVIRIKTREG